MKLTKKLEAEIKALMDDYWDSYFRGDIEHWAKYLVSDYRNIGGTEEEIWNSKKEILDYTYQVIDQMVGQAEIRNKKTEIIPYDPYIMAHEFMDLFIKAEGEWNFYGKFRLSSLIEKIDGEWKVLHQHGSYPDSHTEQGEAFAFNKLRKENTELRDAVKRRTVELELKNRELEIEAALEKVRSRSLAMHQSDELQDAAILLFQQMKALNAQTGSCGFNIWDSEEKAATVWMSSAEGGLQAPFKMPHTESPIYKSVYAAMKSGEAFFVKEVEGKALKKHFDYLVTLPGIGNVIKQLRETGYAFPKKMIYHFAFFNGGYLSFHLHEHYTQAHDIFKRFGKVFQQTYTRFLDLQKAEAQALRAEKDLIEIKLARKKAEEALSELKSTQAQLIQSEKMASLGELTAGIAHEIQNPLNFVNNFSEVNKEMIEELKTELAMGNEQQAIEIANDIKNNEERIIQHGKRADAIVKGMLQHSRKSEGKKEPTDINALADEYLRLSYHGLRAKDKSFNADFKTNFDEPIGKINIVPQDIGRVLLNLFNNAFYAVNEKKKLIANGYQPIAEVKTRRITDKVEIIVSDNGNGIPSTIIDKIFQPFFTTKPTGQGTGLGLSLAYDIITKEHNGTIKVESKEGEGSTFIISLPFI